MKTINNNRVTPSIDTLKKHLIHNYGEQETLTGRVLNDSIREFWRKSGSCQMVFKMVVNNGDFTKIKDMELYVKDEQECSAARKLLLSGQSLTVDYCLRFDQYMDPRGFQTERSFLFIDGLDSLRPQKAA